MQRTSDFRLVCTSTIAVEDAIKAGRFRSEELIIPYTTQVLCI